MKGYFNQTTLYNGELDNIDPFEYGAQLYRDGKRCNSYENDITDKYRGEKDDDPRWQFLENFRDLVEKGWLTERKKRDKEKYLSQLPTFKKSIPEVGSEVYIEHPNSEGERHHCRIEFVTPERDNVLIRYLDDTGSYGQSRVAVVGYAYPGKFVTFHSEKI